MIIKTKSNKDNKIRYYEIFEKVDSRAGFPFDACYQQIRCTNGEFSIGSHGPNLEYRDELIIENESTEK